MSKIVLTKYFAVFSDHSYLKHRLLEILEQLETYKAATNCLVIGDLPQNSLYSDVQQAEDT